MFRIFVRLCAYLLLASCISPLMGQQALVNASDAVPPFLTFSGVLTDLSGKPLTGIVGVSFAVYRDSQEGPPLWQETQNVQPQKNGRYTVVLGSMSSHGIPLEIFAAGDLRWLGVQPQGQPEKPRRCV